MKNEFNKKYLLDISQTEYQNTKSDKIKTTDINILLNRVKKSKKIEFKKRLILISILLLSISFMVVILQLK